MISLSQRLATIIVLHEIVKKSFKIILGDPKRLCMRKGWRYFKSKAIDNIAEFVTAVHTLLQAQRCTQYLVLGARNIVVVNKNNTGYWMIPRNIHEKGWRYFKDEAVDISIGCVYHIITCRTSVYSIPIVGRQKESEECSDVNIFL